MPNHARAAFRARSSPRGRSRGFTIIELLAVIAVIGILATILIPTMGKVRESAKKSKTRVQFSQWATAIEGFRTEYGYYPTFAANKVNGSTGTDVLFRELLSGKGTGTSPSDFVSTEETSPQNKKRINFVSFGTDDVNAAGSVVDAFGNADIVVFVDKDLSGTITFGSGQDYEGNEIVSVQADGKNVAAPLQTTDVVRAGVIFYSGGAGDTAVTSWK